MEIYRYKYFTLILLLCFCRCAVIDIPSKRAFRDIKNNSVVFDAIIVPGIPYKKATWDTVMKARVLWSYVLYKNGIAKNIIFSGGAVYTPYYESKVMGLYAEELGIPESSIYYDTLAKHSVENVYYSYLLAQKEGFKTVALATDPFQSLFLKDFTSKRLGTPIYHLPFVIDSLEKYNHLNPEIVPESAKNASFVPIQKKESLFKRIRGTFGYGIHWRKHKDGMLPAL